MGLHSENQHGHKKNFPSNKGKLPQIETGKPINVDSSRPAVTRTGGLQEQFLKKLRNENVHVFVYLKNGIKLKGQIVSFDEYVIILVNDILQVVYKHSIASVSPSVSLSTFHPS